MLMGASGVLAAAVGCAPAFCSIGAMAGMLAGSFERCFVRNSIVRNTNTGTNETFGAGAFAGYV